MRKLSRELRRTRRAVAALEFALLSVPLMLLVFGVIEFGRLLWTQQALQMTASEAARCVGILANSCSSGGSYSSANTTSYIETVASSWGITLTSSNISPPVTRNSTNTACAPSGGTPNVSEVTLTYTFQTMVPGLLTMLSSNVLTGHACSPNNS
jgi:Flp pilus assembly protein TadG